MRRGKKLLKIIRHKAWKCMLNNEERKMKDDLLDSFDDSYLGLM